VIRRALPFALAIVIAAPCVSSLGAQVGHTPETSPYTDLRGRQALTLSTGLLAPGGDLAGVGPRTGMHYSARYELLLAGPLWLQMRATYAPKMERTYKDPLLTGAARELGTSVRPMAGLEGGFLINVTGNKAWHRIVPQVHGGLGWVTGGTAKFDPGGYRFGNKLTFSYGVGTRLVTGREWEGHVDLTHLFWRYNYPQDYGPNGTAGTASILRSPRLEDWRGNLLLSVGMTRYFFR
jgi:hypothetical protein